MRFEYLNLKAFGHFTDYQLDFDPLKNFHLLYGLNEAGKSTTLRSITNFLYGFPQRTGDSFLHGNQKLRIEGKLQDSKGETLAFIRRKGRKDTVLDLDGTPIDEKLVGQFLQGMPESQFSTMFALDHERLREGGESLLESGGSAGESVFGAASGINLLRKIIAHLENETGDLYKKYGSRPKLNQLLAQEKELKKQISEKQLKIHAWKELEREYYDGKKDIEQLNQRMKELRQIQQKLVRIKQMLPKISKREDLLQKIAELGEVPELPEDIKEIRTATENDLAKANNDIAKLEKDLNETFNQLKEISIPDKILEQGLIIEDLYREIQTYQNNVRNIPELEGKQKQLKDQVISLMKDIDSEHAGLKNIDLYRLSAAKKATIRELIKQKPLLDQEITGLENDKRKLERDLQKKQTELEQFPEIPSMEQLEAAIDHVKRAGSIENLVETLTNSCRQKRSEINEAIQLLPFWSGTYEEFMEFTVPILLETVKKFDNKRSQLDQKQGRLKEQIEEQEKNIEQYEESIRQLESLAEIPSEEILAGVRSSRDEGWKMIRKKLQTGEWDQGLDAYTNGEKIETVYEEKVQEADQIADKMRVEAEKVGQKNKLLADIESGKLKIAALQSDENELKQSFKRWEKDWEELWKPAGITPLSPPEMKEWLEKYETIKEKIRELKTDEEELNKNINRIEQLKNDLLQAVKSFVDVSFDDSLSGLLDTAENKLKQVRDLTNNKNNLSAAIRDIKEKINDCENEIRNQEMKITEWRDGWIKAIEHTSISAETKVTVAEKLLQQYEECANQYEEYVKVVKEQKAIQEQIQLFDKRVAVLLETVDLPLGKQSSDAAVNRLYSLLRKADKDQTRYEALEEKFESIQADLKDAKNELEESQRTLNELCAAANCNNLEELKEIEMKFMQKKDYDQRLLNLEEEMLDLGGGRSVQELIEEAAGYDADKIDGELNDIEHQLEILEKERSEKEQAYGVTKKEYEEKVQGNNSASSHLELEKNSVHAKIADLTDQYIQLKLASILLQKGIEDYRNRNQNPILTRAGEIFKEITLYSFVDLIVDFDENDRPILMGVRKDGDKVDIKEGMSDGTIDQLYLALRIASIEKYADENEPIPFIVDDILVNFDDDRSRATLRILLELSEHTQVIFFTHHARLIEILGEMAADDEYQIIEIGQREAVFHV